MKVTLLLYRLKDLLNGPLIIFSMYHHTVGSPGVTVEVSSAESHPLFAGGSLTLTCNITIVEDKDNMSDGIEISFRWLKGEEQEEIARSPAIELHDNFGFTLEHSFEVLTKEDSNTYECEASLWHHNVGLVATASQSVDITVQGKATIIYL